MFETTIIMGQGVKRKLEDENDVPSTVHQRQSILDISVGKLQIRSVKRVEPPLLKSVLILNTLKYIESELLQEGMHSSMSCSTYTIAEVDPNSTVIDFLPEQEDHSKVNLTEPSPVSLSELQSIQSEAQSGPLPSIDTFVGPKPFYHETKTEVTVEKSSITSLSEASLTTLYQSLRMEEILADFDFSMCDNDMFSCISSGSKLTPLSADEVLHSFPNNCASGGENYTNLMNAVSPFCKGETAIDELDSIMQILVESC